MAGGSKGAGRRPKRIAVGLVLLSVAGLGAGCGRSVKTSSNSNEVEVFAATPLKVALPKFEPGARYTFGRSDQLAAQIKHGGRPDVLVADNATSPAQLYRAGLTQRPVTFASARLVVVVRVPSSHGRVRSVADLSKPGVKIAAAAPGTPLGAATRQALGRLPSSRAKAIRANVKFQGQSATVVLRKVAGGKADAGFVLLPDARPLRNKVRPVQLPASARTQVPAAAVVVKGGDHVGKAITYVKRLTEPNAQKLLRRAGFDPPGG